MDPSIHVFFHIAGAPRQHVIRPQELNLLIDDEIRPRTSSMPSKGNTIPKPQSLNTRSSVSQVLWSFIH